jgi:hypothetical protein
MSNQRIGHPMTGEQENETNKVIAASTFDVPTKENYHPSSGFVHCLVTRVGSSLYHFAIQVGSEETVSLIGHKLSKNPR